MKGKRKDMGVNKGKHDRGEEVRGEKEAEEEKE